MKSSKTKYVMALLDLCKAYDRVSHPLLLYKLHKYGVPTKLGTLIQASYINAGSVIRFQNVITEKKNIALGLKQGCVMSPILFSLYLADLGRILEESGYGIKIHGSTIPGLFFADDIVVYEEEKNFQSLLYILAEYAARWKLQFSAKKSFVMPVNRPVNADMKWCVSFSPVNAEEEFMKEVEIIKYLGINLH